VAEQAFPWWARAGQAGPLFLGARAESDGQSAGVWCSGLRWRAARGVRLCRFPGLGPGPAACLLPPYWQGVWQELPHPAVGWADAPENWCCPLRDSQAFSLYLA